MATKVLSNEFMQNIATEEAWKELSGNFSCTRTKLIGTRLLQIVISDGLSQ